MKATLFILASLGFVALASGPSSAHHAVNIRSDRGGEIGHYAHQFSYYAHDGARVRIAGQCLSACTMYLGLPNVCVYPTAQIGFHQAVDSWGNWSRFGTDEMMRHYPGYLRIQMPLAPALQLYTGMDLIRMGVPPCRHI